MTSVGEKSLDTTGGGGDGQGSPCLEVNGAKATGVLLCAI